MKPRLQVLLLIALMCWGSHVPAQTSTTNATINAPALPEILATLKPGHPRLLVNAADWKTLTDRKKTDPELAKVVARIEADAQALLPLTPLTYKKEGKRLLDVSRAGIQRILIWTIAYHVTGEKAYAERARVELLNLAAFADWNPSHFLDTAEMTTALALGYDWLYDELDPATRATLRRAIVEKGLQPGLKVVAGKGGWPRTENNWNQVCFGGLTLGALAIADEEPEIAGRMLTAAKANISHGLKPYAPDGVYPEGPGYWDYGTTYQVLMLEGLQSALGTRWKLDASPGFMTSAGVVSQLTSPSGKYFNFADCSENRDLQPAMFWFARETHDPGLLRYQRPALVDSLSQSALQAQAYHENRFFPLIALWWTSAPEETAVARLPRLWHGAGQNPVGVFRTSWTDTNALYLAFKGGAANLSHGHMDAGSFVLEADGVRWATDLGRQEYFSLESKGVDLWNREQASQRWQVFRLNNRAHNTLTIGGELHRVGGNARITEFHTNDNPGATLDLSPVFAGQADTVTRRFELLPERTVGIHDELTGVKPGTEVRWAMVTRAQVETAGNRATLKKSGKQLQARIVSPTNAVFAVIPADPPKDDFNAPNPDTRILTVTVKAPESGTVRLDIELQPGH